MLNGLRPSAVKVVNGLRSGIYYLCIHFVIFLFVLHYIYVYIYTFMHSKNNYVKGVIRKRSIGNSWNQQVREKCVQDKSPFHGKNCGKISVVHVENCLSKTNLYTCAWCILYILYRKHTHTPLLFYAYQLLCLLIN